MNKALTEETRKPQKNKIAAFYGVQTAFSAEFMASQIATATLEARSGEPQEERIALRMRSMPLQVSPAGKILPISDEFVRHSDPRLQMSDRFIR